MKRILYLLLFITGTASAQVSLPDSTSQGGTNFTPQFNYIGINASTSKIQFRNPLNGKYFGIYSAYQQSQLFPTFTYFNTITGTSTLARIQGKVDSARLYGTVLPTYVSTLGSYTNPSWLVSLPWSKITATDSVTKNHDNLFGITDKATARANLQVLASTNPSSSKYNYFVNGIDTLYSYEGGHAQEGGVVNMGGDTLLFAYNFSENQVHQDTASYSRKRFSYDKGVTWSSPQTLYRGYDGALNITMGITDDKKLFAAYWPSKVTNVWRYMTSTDGGATFSAPTSVTAPVLAYGGIPQSPTPYGKMFKAYGKYFQVIQGQYWSLLYSSADGQTGWTVYSTMWDYTVSLVRNTLEPDVTVLEGANGICRVRAQGTTGSYYQYQSTDSLKTWTYIGQTVLQGVTGFAPSPQGYYDRAKKKLITIAADRGPGTSYPTSNGLTNGINIYSNDVSEIWGNPSGYTLIAKLGRPAANKSTVYDYPTGTMLDDSTMYYIVTDRSNADTRVVDGNTGEVTGFSKFTISHNGDLFPNAADVSGVLTKNIITGKYENRVIQQPWVYDQKTALIQPASQSGIELTQIFTASPFRQLGVRDNNGRLNYTVNGDGSGYHYSRDTLSAVQIQARNAYYASPTGNNYLNLQMNGFNAQNRGFIINKITDANKGYIQFAQRNSSSTTFQGKIVFRSEVTAANQSGGYLIFIPANDNINKYAATIVGALDSLEASSLTATGLLEVKNGTSQKFSIDFAGKTRATTFIATTMAAGTAGTDSLLVKSGTTNEIRKISPTFYAPSTRTLTINGTALDLSANRSWSVGTVTNVTSANTDIGVATGTVTPVLTWNRAMAPTVTGLWTFNTGGIQNNASYTQTSVVNSNTAFTYSNTGTNGDGPIFWAPRIAAAFGTPSGGSTAFIYGDGTVRPAILTVATLPTASTRTGAIATVTDALAPTWGAAVVAGGSASAFVISDGANWIVH